MYCGMTSSLPYAENALQHIEKVKRSFETIHKEKPTSMLERLGEVEKDPWSLAFKIVTKRLVRRRAKDRTEVST